MKKRLISLLLVLALCLGLLPAAALATEGGGEPSEGGESTGHVHSFGEWEERDGKHVRTCILNDCPNGEDATETADHSIPDTYASDDSKHWKECTVCKARISEAAHTATDDTTNAYKYDNDNHWKICKDCNKPFSSAQHSISIAGKDSDGHTKDCTTESCGFSATEAHSFTWSSDGENGHTGVCNTSGCAYTLSEAHTLTVKSDSDKHWRACAKTGCEYSADQGAHTGGATYQSDDDNHWKVCTFSGCGAKIGVAAHADSASDTDSKCDTCGYDMTLKGSGTGSNGSWSVSLALDGGSLPSADATLKTESTGLSADNAKAILTKAGYNSPSDVNSLEKVTVASSKITDAESWVIDGETYRQGQVLDINGNKYVLQSATIFTNSASSSYLDLYRVADGRAGQYYYARSTSQFANFSSSIVLEAATTKISINEAVYDVRYIAEDVIYYLYIDGVPAGAYNTSTKSAAFHRGYDPETVEEDQTITPDFTFVDKDGKFYDGYILFAQDLSLVNGSNNKITWNKSATATISFVLPSSLKNADLEAVHIASSGVERGSVTKGSNNTATASVTASSLSPFIVLAIMEDTDSGVKTEEVDTLWVNPYSDVKVTDWFYEAVEYVSKNGLMGSTSTAGHVFSPNGITTRAQLVTILYRLEGSPYVSGAIPFTDVRANQWYTDPIRWAARTGVVTGNTDGTFNPDDPITREQFATILCRYAAYTGKSTSTVGDYLSRYPDVDRVNSYAITSLNWAVAQGIVTGTTSATGTRLDPQGGANRAQAATMLQRFCEIYIA